MENKNINTLIILFAALILFGYFLPWVGGSSGCELMVSIVQFNYYMLRAVGATIFDVLTSISNGNKPLLSQLFVFCALLLPLIFSIFTIIVALMKKGAGTMGILTVVLIIAPLYYYSMPSINIPRLGFGAYLVLIGAFGLLIASVIERYQD